MACQYRSSVEAQAAFTHEGLQCADGEPNHEGATRDLQSIKEMLTLSPLISLCFLSPAVWCTFGFQGEKSQSWNPTHFWGQDIYFVHKKWMDIG